LLYCQKILASDPGRQHVYAFTTDLTNCWLLRVTSDFVKSVATQSADSTAVKMACFPWYDSQADTLTGIQILLTLGCMSPTDLGMSSMYKLDRPVTLRALGSGASADVFEVKFADTEASSVLKIPKNSTVQLDAELGALEHLNHLAAGISPTARRAARKVLHHVPELLALTNLQQRHLVMSPVAVPLQHSNVTVAIVGELFELLEWTHVSCGWLHGDISHHNLMIAPPEWRLFRDDLDYYDVDSLADELETSGLAASWCLLGLHSFLPCSFGTKLVTAACGLGLCCSSRGC
jgi:hypothetical protein